MERRRQDLTSPKDVLEAFAEENSYLSQRKVYASGEGPDAREVSFQAVATGKPERVLDVGCGLGEFAERMTRELGASVIAIDISARMVELTKARRITAYVGDAEALTFPDSSFDCVVANWVFQYIPDPRRAMAEIARVLRPGGRLVTATNGESHMGEVWDLIFGTEYLDLPFSRENGEELLQSHFRSVSRMDVDGTVVFDNREEVARWVSGHMGGDELARQVPDFTGPFRVTRRASVFVAER